MHHFMMHMKVSLELTFDKLCADLIVKNNPPPYRYEGARIVQVDVNGKPNFFQVYVKTSESLVVERMVLSVIPVQKISIT